VTYEVNGIEPSITLGECIGGDSKLDVYYDVSDNLMPF
jgi:hypothetical protein